LLRAGSAHFSNIRLFDRLERSAARGGPAALSPGRLFVWTFSRELVQACAAGAISVKLAPIPTGASFELFSNSDPSQRIAFHYQEPVRWKKQPRLCELWKRSLQQSAPWDFKKPPARWIDARRPGSSRPGGQEPAVLAIHMAAAISPIKV
jgi:hypothetical protein